MEPGLSARNPRVQAAARLHRSEERRATGLTLLEGPRLLEEAEANGVVIRDVFSTDPGQGTFITNAALERLSSTRTPQTPVAVIETPARPLTPGRSVLVAWDIADPGNLGTMIRTASAFGLDVMATADSADIWSPKVLRAAAGAHFHTGIGEVDLGGFMKVATIMTGGSDPSELPLGPIALLIGNEAHGLPTDVISSADHRVSIRMPGGTESLNAAAATAILCYEVATRSTSEIASPVNGLHHVQLAMPAGGEARAVEFYSGLLGIPQVEKPGHLANRGGCWFESGQTRIHLGVEEDFRPAKKAHPALLVTELERMVARLSAAGVGVGTDQPLLGFSRVYVEDPFGNRIELLQANG